MVSPRGNAAGSNPASFTTSYGYDAFGDLTKITDPMGHVTTFGFDPNRNRTSLTDLICGAGARLSPQMARLIHGKW